MNYNLIKDLLVLAEDFEKSGNSKNAKIEDFENWLYENRIKAQLKKEEPVWEGKEKGRSAESVINTLIVHMNRYAKNYSKAIIHDSGFSTQEEFIYLINLRAFGAMTKMQLIKKNIQEKPVGMQIINRLLKQNWVVQVDSEEDKRSKVLNLTPAGLNALEERMDKIKAASKTVTGDLDYNEKIELIRLLQKLECFHKPIFDKNLSHKQLLGEVIMNRA